MNIREQSTHLSNDKKSNDPLERILEPWGVWRQWGVDGLSSKRKSPLEGYNALERVRTDKCDLRRILKIREDLIKRGVDKRNLKELAEQEWRELKMRINSTNVPRETQKVSPISPNYGGHKYYAKVDRILSEIHGLYYNILIRKYEDQWEYRDFAKHHGISENLASQRIFKARRAARKILKKNGYKT